MEPSVSSTVDLKHAVRLLQMPEQVKACPKPNCKIPVLPLLTIFLQFNEVPQDTFTELVTMF
jgi:hypothetical protein